MSAEHDDVARQPAGEASSPAAKIQIRNSIQVGISDSARSWPRMARNSVNAPPTAPMIRNDSAREGGGEPRVDDGDGDERRAARSSTP